MKAPPRCIVMPSPSRLELPGVKKMNWETPTFVEVKMEAEINSYQDDFGDDRDTGV